jgi:hypothetical protein
MSQEKGKMEPIEVPIRDVCSDPTRDFQTKLIMDLIRDANQLGLEGKRVSAVTLLPTFGFRTLKFQLEWEKP